jgi:hypothetical protein
MRSVKWIVALVPLVVAAGCGTRESEQAPQPEGSAMATLRTANACNPAVAAARWQPRVGEFTTARFLWNDLPDAAAHLEVPFGVMAVRDDGVAVHLPRIPLRERYLGMWLMSGHLRLEGDQLVLDPCAAELAS